MNFIKPPTGNFAAILCSYQRHNLRNYITLYLHVTLLIPGTWFSHYACKIAASLRELSAVRGKFNTRKCDFTRTQRKRERMGGGGERQIERDLLLLALSYRKYFSTTEVNPVSFKIPDGYSFEGDFCIVRAYSNVVVFANRARPILFRRYRPQKYFLADTICPAWFACEESLRQLTSGVRTARFAARGMQMLALTLIPSLRRCSRSRTRHRR